MKRERLSFLSLAMRKVNQANQAGNGSDKILQERERERDEDQAVCVCV